MRLSSKQWNQGNLDRTSYAMQRRRAAHQVVIEAPADHVFERACLASQPAWLPEGSLRLSCSESGRNELGAVWIQNDTGPSVLQRPQRPQAQTVWTTTRLDPNYHHYQAVLMSPELAMGTLDVAMVEQDGGTLVRFELSYTAISETGSTLLAEVSDQALEQVLEGFGRTLASSLAGPAAPVTPASHLASRQGAEHEITINGDIDTCFDLACPVAELRWIDGWSFDLLYSSSGKNETGCTFMEPSSGLSMLRSPGADNYWYVTRYDTEQHRFDAVWLTQDQAIAHWKVRMTSLEIGQTRVTWSLVYTGLSREGSSLISEPGMAGRMQRGLGFLASALRHYVETGSILRLSSRRKLQLVASLIGACLGRHLRRRGVKS